LESIPKNLLAEFRKQKTAIDRQIIESPPISQGFIAWLHKEFPREQFKGNDPLTPQKLLIREGMEMIFRHLSFINEQQEKGVRDVHSEDKPNRLIQKHHEEELLKR